MIPETAPARLLVEGPDDKHSVIHLMKRHGVDWDAPTKFLPYVRDCDGIDVLLDSIKVSAKTYRRLGIVLDANTDISQRWSQLSGRFATVNITLPSEPDREGTLLDGIFPDHKVGVWVMPDNAHHGELEHFLKTLVPSDDRCWSYAKHATRHAKKLGAFFVEKDALKSTIHTWLSWQEEPGLPFGTAIKAAYFNHDSPEALKFVAWFKRLFLCIH